MTSSEVRQKFLEFFEKKGHAIVPSSSLVPENDPTTLFTGSGMQPLIPYLLGQPHPSGRRIANSQKCFRAEDIEEVGDNRHTTFFEMLGNWSFGDYWKEEQLPWFFEFLTVELGLDPAKLYVSIFAGDPATGVPKDEESREIWTRLFKEKGIDPAGRIFEYGVEKNWWSRSGVPAQMPVGEPGGPDSEVFYEFVQVEHDPEFGEKCHPNCDCGRFLEIGNSVFMEYGKTGSGFEKLAQRNVDFGGGLERITMASIDRPDIFRIDVFEAMGEPLSEYQEAEDVRKKRIALDHLRGAINLIGAGVIPSNKERGYILRRILRRAIFHIISLTRKDAAVPLDSRPEAGWGERTSGIINSIVSRSMDFYPGLKEKEKEISGVISKEIGKFTDVLGSRSELEKAIRDSRGTISGEKAFILFSTYGLPIDYIQDEAQRAGLTVDRPAFEAAMKAHRDLSRTASAGTFKGGLADASERTIRLHTAHHLLLKALQIVLGPEVKQRGSNIKSERLRMDFSHGAKMTEEQKQKVERMVNEKITEDLPVIRSEMPLAEAEKLGAEHEFGQKYPERVSVYSVGPKEATPENPRFSEAFSLEFCGGPHVSRTKEIGKFKILKEEAVSAGIRRIRATVE